MSEPIIDRLRHQAIVSPNNRTEVYPGDVIEELESQLANARQAALEEAARIAERYQENYPEDIFTTNGTSVDAQSARCMRIASDNIAAEIRKAAEKTGVGLHASQQPHAVDLASAPLRPNH